MNKILNAKDIEFAEGVFDDAVVGKRNALLVDLSISALVDEFTDSLQVGLAGDET